MTNRPQRESDGKYHIKGQTYKKLKGSRREVWNKTAYKTEGQLLRDQLMQNKNRRIVSRKKVEQAKKNNNLVKAGWALAKPGKFGAEKSSTRKRHSRRSKRRS